MGNCPTDLRRAILFRDEEGVEQVLQSAGGQDKAAYLINADHSPDCILDSCSSVQGNALYYAVRYHHEESIILLLLNYGGDFYETGEFGETCLHAAARLNRANTCKILIGRGADLYATDDNGRYPIHSAAQSVYDTVETIKYLLGEAGKRNDVNLGDFNNRTPLHEAVYHRNIGAVKTLIEYGADINARSKAGNTPLHMAMSNSKVWDILVSKGAHTDIKNDDGKLPGEIL